MFESFYGLSANPFRLSADEGFRFAHRSYKKAWSYLKYALDQAEGFVLVTGRPGTGKTTLIRDIINDIDPSKLTVVKLITNQFQSEELLRMIALELGFEAQDYNKATLLTRLSDHAAQLNTQGRRIVIIVDEAQNLTENGLEELRLVSNLQIGNQSLFQIFLVGQEELRGLINMPGMHNLKQRIIASTRIEQLDEKQTREYINHRLDMVGWDHDPEVDEQLYPLIQKLTHGIPREINHAVGRLLLYGALEEKHKLSEDDFWTVVKELNRERRLGIDIEDQLEAYKERQRNGAVDNDSSEELESESDQPLVDASKEPESDAAEKEIPSEEIAEQVVDEQAISKVAGAEESIVEPDSAVPVQFDQDQIEDDNKGIENASDEADTEPVELFGAATDSPRVNLHDQNHLDLPEIHIEGQGDVVEEVKSQLLTDVDDLFGEKRKFFSWRLLFYPLAVLIVVLLIMRPDPDALLKQGQQVWDDFNKNFIQKPTPGSVKPVATHDSASKNMAEVESKKEVQESRVITDRPKQAAKERVEIPGQTTDKLSPATSENPPEEEFQEIKLKQHYFLMSEDAESGLTRQSQLRLEAAVQLLEKYPTTVLKLTGLTTPEGSPIKQMRTALKHANSVATQVNQAGISKKRILIEGIKPDGWESDGFDFKRSESQPDGWIVVFEVFAGLN